MEEGVAWGQSRLIPVSDLYPSPDFSNAALITIDTQRDVLDGGPLEIAGTSAALGPMRVLVEAVRDAVSGLYGRGERELGGIGVHLLDSAEVAERL